MGRNAQSQCLECRRLRKRKDRGELTKARRLARARTELDFGYLARKQIKRYPMPRANTAELRALWESQGGKCGLTGMSLAGVRPHIEHKVPVSRGGGSAIGNLQFAHPMANHAKGTASVEEFRAWLLAAADALRQKIELEKLL